ncbi:MAG TPA: L,D-transpeptidase family protein [Vicinamibacterales bacterium]|nr:L,D-transpeptidase family protein [Vicinamibacterales bacterium]
MPVAQRVVAIVVSLGVCASCSDRHEAKQHARHGQAVGTSGRSDGVDVATVLQASGTPPFVARDREGSRLWGLTKQFYQKRANEPVWIDGRKPRPQLDELIGVLQQTDRDGLDPELYNASMLKARRTEAGRGFLTMKGFDEKEAANLDVWLTYLYLQYASDLTNGVSDLSHADPKWQLRAKKSDPLTLLDDALAHNRVAASLEELTPDHPQYVKLREALARYRDIRQHGGWPQLPAQLRLKPGQRSPAAADLARRLAVTGDYSGAIGDAATVYGSDLQEAVKRFQRRHGLEPDGVVGAALVAQMNRPVERRIEQIELNLERWRWLPRTLGDRFVLVNIPEYRLEVWDHDQVPVMMKVVVGKKETPTPIFTDNMTYIIFAPYWNVPPAIAAKETLPHVLSDQAFLQKMNMEVLDASGQVVDPASIDLSNAGAYRFRQRPGASNSLGLVKFMFPNQYDIYLHDTPADSLFARAVRSFSHGCVRLEQPEQLAEYVLRDQPDWTVDRIEAAMHGGVEKTVKLRGPLPVYLGYWTARVSADGLLQFRDDLYGIDARQQALLAATLDRRRAQADKASRTLTEGTNRR